MDWQKWILAGMMIMMVIYIFPRAKYMLKESPKGSSSDWKGFVLIIVVIALFIGLLIQML